MTIDKAISLLKQYIDYNNPDIPDFYTMEEACKVVIKVLEQEPCDDAVSRQDVEDAIYDYSRSCDVDYAQIMEFIDKLPSVTAQQRWIPVSERLPEKYKEVIVTDNETSDTYQSQYIGNGYWECDTGRFKNRIIAWMPLPQPYKSEIPTGEEGRTQ